MEIFTWYISSQPILFNVEEQGTKFLYGKILENTDAGRHYDRLFPFLSEIHAAAVFQV